MLDNEQDIIRQPDVPGAVLSTDLSGLEGYKRMKSKFKKIDHVDNLQKEVNSLTNRVAILEEMVLNLMGRNV